MMLKRNRHSNFKSKSRHLVEFMPFQLFPWLAIWLSLLFSSFFPLALTLVFLDFLCLGWPPWLYYSYVAPKRVRTRKKVIFKMDMWIILYINISKKIKLQLLIENKNNNYIALNTKYFFYFLISITKYKVLRNIID